MAANAVPDDVYPIASDKGEAIPLATVRPLGAIYEPDFQNTGPVTLTFLEEINLISIYTKGRAILRVGTQDAIGSYLTNTFVLHGGVQYELIVPTTCFIDSTVPDNELIINVLERWSQLRNEGSYTNS